MPTSETPIDQKRAIMQNKPNFRKAKMNLNPYPTKYYENDNTFRLPENKPNQTQPNPNLPEGKIDAKCVLTKDYEEKCGYGPWKNKPNSNPIKSLSWAQSNGPKQNRKNTKDMAKTFEIL